MPAVAATSALRVAATGRMRSQGFLPFVEHTADPRSQAAGFTSAAARGFAANSVDTWRTVGTRSGRITFGSKGPLRSALPPVTKKAGGARRRRIARCRACPIRAQQISRARRVSTVRRASHRSAASCSAVGVTRLAWPVAVAFTADPVCLVPGGARGSVARHTAERRQFNEIRAGRSGRAVPSPPARCDELRFTQLEQLKVSPIRRERAKVAPSVMPPIVALYAV